MSATLHSCEAALASLPEEPLLVAVSGGVDSVALLHALAGVGRKPVVLHFDHGWRAESAADAEWVRAEARRLGLKCVTAKMRASPKASREAEARAARYAFFARAARKLGTAHVVLAHHADDQVETFLLQLLRGAGAAGRGMEPVARRDGLVLHRPWLGIWKKEIIAYARKKKLAWREDATNADPRYRRNRVRGELLPYLRRKFGSHVEQNLWRAAEIVRAESEWLDALCADMIGQAELATRSLRDAPPAQQRRTILRWLQERDVPDISFADVEAVRGLLEHREPAKVNLGAGKFARRRAGKIFVQ